MLKRNFVQRAALPVVILVACGLVNQFAAGANALAATAKIDAFTAPDGVTDFAVSLKPGETAASTAPRDVVVLFSTSASQTGEYRAKAIEALRGVLAGLTGKDRVQLMAVDLNAVPMTKAFVAPDSPEMAAALAALESRVPLGASDMEKSLNAVLSSFAANSIGARAALYIGDGRSSANVLDVNKFRTLAGKLVEARIPVSSYVLGGRIDAQLAGALAVQTGGTVIADADALGGGEAGRRLAAAADVTVLWPTKVTQPAEMSEVFPKTMPPLRGDRETILIGVLKGSGPLNMEVTADSAAGPQNLAFSLPAATSNENNSYLVRLVERARADGGITLPLLGTASLTEAEKEISAGVRNLTHLAREALSEGNLADSERFVNAALRSDPNDSDALAVQSALAKRQPIGAAKGGAGPLPAAPLPPGSPGDGADLNLGGPAAGEPLPGALAESVQNDRRVITQLIQTEVQNALSKARSLMSTDPDAVTQQLKITLEKVRQTTELNPEVRDQLAQSLEGALRDTARRKIEMEQIRQQRLESTAAGQERQLIADNLLRNEQKVKQLMDRFASLMNEGRMSWRKRPARWRRRNWRPIRPCRGWVNWKRAS